MCSICSAPPIIPPDVANSVPKTNPRPTLAALAARVEYSTAAATPRAASFPNAPATHPVARIVPISTAICDHISTQPSSLALSISAIN